MGRSERRSLRAGRTKCSLNKFISAAGGFNPANPTAVTSANVIDPNLKAPVTQSVVAGVDRELMPNLAVQVNYSYTRTSDLFGNFADNITPRVGVVARGLRAGHAAHRHAARRHRLQRADVHSERRRR